MRRLVILGIVVGVLITMLPPAWTAVKLNSSKSNIYRLTYPADLLGQAQATSLLAELDRVAQTTWVNKRGYTTSGIETVLRQWLAANLRRFGVARDRVQKIVILFPGRARDEAVQKSVAQLPAEYRRGQPYDKADPRIWILLLTNPADEPAAIAVSYCFCPAGY